MKTNKTITLHVENDTRLDFSLEFDKDINIRTTCENPNTSEAPDEITSVYVSVKEAREIIIALEDMIGYLEREEEKRD